MVDADRNQVHGGKTVYGASVGILMLETPLSAHPGRHRPCRNLAVPGAGGARRHS
jgi:hypothetical protein